MLHNVTATILTLLLFYFRLILFSYVQFLFVLQIPQTG